MRFNISALAGAVFAGRKNAHSATRFLYAVPAVLRRALPPGAKKHPRRMGAARV